MWLNNPRKLAIVTAICCAGQGYVFDTIIKVEPHPLVIFGPLILFLIYLLGAGSMDIKYRDPSIWTSGIIILTLAGIGFYASLS